MRLVLLAIAALLASGAFLFGGTANEPPPATIVLMDPEIRWRPESPGEGSLFVVRVQESIHTPVIGVHGTFASEALHFRRTDSGAFESYAAMPVGPAAPPSLELRVLYAEGGEERFDRQVELTPGTYEHEELRVAPRFGAPPDSAAQARLARDREKARGAARTAHGTPPLWDYTVMLPRASRVTSGFGDGRRFNGQVSSRHMGLDLQGLRGDTVVASARGVVVLTEPFLLAGNVVYLNHGAGLLSAYFHLSRQLVAVGDTVNAGQPIGLVGATGRVTGPHLHWVVRYGNTSVDPRSLIDLLTAEAEQGSDETGAEGVEDLRREG